MARITFSLFAGIIGMGTLAVAGCGHSSGTTSFFGGISTTGSSTTPGGQNAIAGIGGNNTAAPPAAAGTSIGAAGGSTAGGGGWVLSAPQSVFGFPQIKPSAASLAKIQSTLANGAASLGVTGTQVIAVYDDRPHGLYLVFAGYNGTGFDPARLQAAYKTRPVTNGDGAGDQTLINNVTVDPGPHGGTAGCNSVMTQNQVGTIEATSCSWMTTTTMGVFFPFPNEQHPNVLSEGPDTMAKAMRALRDQVEHRS